MNPYLALRSVFQQFLEHMRSDIRCLRTWPHKLHRSDKDHWCKVSVFTVKTLRECSLIDYCEANCVNFLTISMGDATSLLHYFKLSHEDKMARYYSVVSRITP